MRLNPFQGALVVPYIKVTYGDIKWDEKEGAKVRYYEVEADKHTRLYRKSNMLGIVLSLTAPGHKLFTWICYNLKNTYIRLDDVELCQVFDCSGKTIGKMRGELVEKAIIAKKEQNHYWVNPDFIASDSRLKLFPENKLMISTINSTKETYD